MQPPKTKEKALVLKQKICKKQSPRLFLFGKIKL